MICPSSRNVTPAAGIDVQHADKCMIYLEPEVSGISQLFERATKVIDASAEVTILGSPRSGVAVKPTLTTEESPSGLSR